MPGFLGRYLAGIWECTMPQSLLWWSEYTDTELYPEATRPTHRRERPCSAPTWSWLSVEGRVSTWGRGALTLARLLGFTYDLAGEDTYGPCKKASITLLGKVELVEIDLKPHEKKPAYLLGRPGINEHFDFLSDTNPFEFSLQEVKQAQIIALQVGFSPSPLGSHNCIILKLNPGFSRDYVRLGIADCGDNWFSSNERHIITVI